MLKNGIFQIFNCVSKPEVCGGADSFIKILSLHYAANLFFSYSWELTYNTLNKTKPYILL